MADSWAVALRHSFPGLFYPQFPPVNMNGMMMRMKCLLALAGAFAVTVAQERQAEVHLSCLDLRFAPASSGSFGLETTLTLGTGEGNGEVFFFPEDFSHMTAFVLTMPGANLSGLMELDVPPFTDENENGLSDFFESSQPVWRTVTQGRYRTNEDFDSGAVRATWQRAQDERFGSCELVLTSDIFGQLPAFRHEFELLEYHGRLTYTPGPETFTGQVDLERTGMPGRALSGPMEFHITGATGAGEVAYSSGAWHGPEETRWEFLEGILDRDGPQPNSYLAFFVFMDGDPETSLPDFQQWVLRITDPNDADGDGKPDLSDPPSGTPADGPILSLTRSGEGLGLEVAGSPGVAYVIESTTDLSNLEWTTVAEITLTSETWIIEIDQTKPFEFFRGRVKE
jgi:hypothetical protein